MSLVVRSFALCLLLYSVLDIGRCTHTLKQVQVLFRHGERAPLKKEMYPNDPHSVSDYLPWDLGQLTNIGKLREFRIGEMLRARYNDFLGDYYYPKDIYGRSSDSDRTKMSLQLVLSSLYPAKNFQNWNPNLPWLPIPTHYAPENLDILMRPHLCTQFTQHLGEIKRNPTVISLIAQYSELFEFLSTTTGFNITTTTQVYEIYNLLVAQKSMNLTLPQWCTEKIFEDMGNVTVLEYKILSFDKHLKRLNGGTLVRRFVDNMNVTGKRSGHRKLYLYSGHEVNIAAFLRAHDITKPALPVYGTAVIFEKLENATGDVFVKMFVWTGITEEIIPLKIGDCDYLCPIDTYLNIVKDVLPSDKELNCHLDKLSHEDLAHLYDEKISFN
ncbi:venom acid phosphatase Acph-1 [Cephus cinctus]|uniref:acid phosphatase n=1 Tax=Cephus cinctus TaxID=211228 RepID=A0AAJ7BN39_CEPCN|nr:venom acid phosphatase Acph-1 [Cephus cinctus]XP_024938428.1 venom acid phosphatase Acph-1 [Cephus cinctus]